MQTKIKDFKNIADIHVPSTVQTENLKNVNVNPDLNADEKRKVWRLLEEYQDIFSDVPTQTNLMTMSIELTSDEPIRHRPYSVPIHLQDKVRAELKQMLDMGWIRHGSGQYASPLIIVKKKETDGIRLCVSYKDLNAICKTDAVPMPLMDNILAQLGKSRICFVADCCKGFYSIPIEEESQKYTGFVFENAYYFFTVVPFGLKNSPSCFSKLMQKLLNGAQHMANFVDDIIAYDNCLDEHIVTLTDLFQRARKANLKLKPSKTNIGFQEVTYLSHIVGHGKVRPTDQHIDKILSAPIPVTKKAVRSLVGAINWVRKFLPQAARLLEPITSLLCKDQSDKVQWGPKQQEVWDELKVILTSKPVLSLYDASREHMVCTDASSVAIGGVYFSWNRMTFGILCFM